MSAPDRITLALTGPEGATLDAIRKFARLGDAVDIGGLEVVIEAACNGSAIAQLAKTETLLAQSSQGLTPPTPLTHGQRLLLSLSIALANQSRTASEVIEARDRLRTAEQAAQSARECADKISEEIYAHAERLGKAGTGVVAGPAPVDETQGNQIAREGENVNQPQNQQQNIPGIIPAGWSDKQVLDFCSVAFRHVVFEGDLKFSDINDALRYMADKGEPAFVRAFDLDEHVKMAADAARYRWLRDVAWDTPRQDLALRDKSGSLLIEQDMDAEIDCAMRAFPGELEDEPCDQ